MPPLTPIATLTTGVILAALVPVAASGASDVAVESIGLVPGQAKSFVLRPGGSHQLLVPAAPDAPGAITLVYRAGGGRSAIVATSMAGPVTFSVLADPEGDGGYVRAGSVAVSGDGQPTRQGFDRELGAIVVGDVMPAA